MSLHIDHRNPGIHWIDDRGQRTPGHYGDPAAERAALASGCALIDLSHGGVVALAGAERMSFLSGLITNQIKEVSPERSLYAALLSPQGRFLWDFTLVALGEELLLVTEPARVAALVERLHMYKLRAKITITDASQRFGLLAVAGPAAGAAMAAAFPGQITAEAAPGATRAPAGEVRLWRDPRHPAFGWRLLAPAAELDAYWSRLGERIPPAGFLAWEDHRIGHALPRGGADLIPEQTLPLEAGFLELNGVSFTKGCYVGQETTARTHHRGTLKQRLHQVSFPPGAALSCGLTVTTRGGGKEVGTLTSLSPQADRGLGLAILRRSDVTGGAALEANGVALAAHKPDWATWE
ncbi:MAG: folate-binding protein YgfZ [Magnetococcales bacterium]|nr:folate-binding protein YgfZ [Magnetococcales bacterium]